MTVLADTGAVYALIDRSDAWHRAVVTWWGAARRPAVLLPEIILPEVCYLLATRIGSRAENAFVRAIVRGEFELELLEEEDIRRAAALMAAYESLPLGFVDAAITAMAERLESTALLTTDRRHFSVIRPRHAEGFELLP
ncbi:MAG: ribonuclease VapC [Gemmatimonadales bacterium]|nr:MAG: ribonuclease VapC [Gemmatimonadales bacterium]